MTAIYTTTLGTTLLGMSYGKNDDSLQPADYRFSLTNCYETSDSEMVDVAWTRSSFRGGMGAAIENMQNVWEWNYPLTGQHSPKKVAGITKDSSGAALGSVTVLLFNTATSLYVDTVVSDSTGAYELSDPNNVSCFVVGYLSGTPDTTGTTKNNLAGV